jgi:hypothetical protein
MKTIDAETGNIDPLPKQRRIPLKTLRQVHREMAYCYRDNVAGRLESNELAKRIYALDRIGNAVQMAELERQVQDLQARLMSRGAAPLLMLPEKSDDPVSRVIERNYSNDVTA